MLFLKRETLPSAWSLCGLLGGFNFTLWTSDLDIEESMF